MLRTCRWPAFEKLDSILRQLVGYYRLVMQRELTPYRLRFSSRIDPGHFQPALNRVGLIGRRTFPRAVKFSGLIDLCRFATAANFRGHLHLCTFSAIKNCCGRSNRRALAGWTQRHLGPRKRHVTRLRSKRLGELNARENRTFQFG